MVQVELKNMYRNIGTNKDSEKLWTKNTATSGKLIKAVYASYVYVYLVYILALRKAVSVWRLPSCGVLSSESEVIAVDAIKASSGVELQLRSFLTSALYRGEWLVLLSGRFTSEEIVPITFWIGAGWTPEPVLTLCRKSVQASSDVQLSA
jgi:hypothetical protein